MSNPVQSVDKRKFYQKLRFILPISFCIAFTVIYLIWKDYPNRLIRDDQSPINQEVEYNRNIDHLGLWKYELGLDSQLNVQSFNSAEELKSQSKFEEIGSKYGTYGDTYGSLNTLFTGWAFAGLIISIFLQMLELKATRKELAEQKEALKGQHKEFEAQTGILTKQIDLIEKQKTIAENQSSIIDNQLIESRKQNFTSILNSLMEERRFRIECLIVYTPAENTNDLKGFEVIKSYGLNLIQRMNEIKKDSSFLDALKKFKQDANESNIENARDLFRTHWHEIESNHNHHYSIGNYFSIIFGILYLIEEYKDVLGSSHEFYIEMIKRIINQHELIILFWISLGHPQNDEIIYRYKLFERLSYTEGLGVLGRNIFKIEAFGSNKNWTECFEKN